MSTPTSPPNQPSAGSPGKERASKSPDPTTETSQQSPGPTTETPLQWSAAPLDADDVEEDPGFNDASSSTASLSSSVLQYRTIQGRTYHSNRGEAEYWGPNDEKQLESMDITHHAHTLILGGKLCLAPIKDDIQKVVDVGTGTGLWAIDFADAYPNCEVVGTDLSPIQPTWVPPNLKFEIDDCSQTWTFEPNSIDFVHIRFLTGSIQDWHALFREAYRCTKPGGYIQSFEATPWMESDDGTVAEDSAMAQWSQIFIEGGKRLGRTFTMIPDGIQKGGIEDAGFVDIKEADFKSPLGRWPKDRNLKEIGACTAAAVYDDVEGIVMYMATLLGWGKEEVMVYAARLRKELRNPAIHAYYRMRVVWARKPEV